jgi:hypothetical protein
MIKPGQNPLGKLLLAVAGRAPTNFYVARREARVLADAMPHLSAAERVEAQDRIATLQTKWGTLLTNAQNQGQNLSLKIEPVQLIAQWLSRRHEQTRLLDVLERAAIALESGETNLAEITDQAYAEQTDRTLIAVRPQTFRAWLIQLRIAQEKCGGGIEPGPWIDAWVDGTLKARTKICIGIQ